MPTSSGEIQAVAHEESDRVVLRDQRGAGSGENPEGSCAMAHKITMDYDRLTDVMHVDFCIPSGDDRVDVVDVGEQAGFPGQVVARVNSEHRIFYGLTIQNFSSFKRKLFWMYKMASIQCALELMLNMLRAGLWIDRNNRPARLGV
ncbi:MAG: hypothetical protein WAM04_05965 [Candidatus Sulfotelmatobacter sp.]